ncbi:MAG TPA: amylo-alpha-1,6-glucosidase [Phycisphaerae bacterium]|nr:amylo-alpha-1,6-glucosidase [Phycisphaerae bacterium]HON65012.1 amylo-alpha-1,6-glucosidase [Phycisphaerae bacterium]HOQ86386.1 amylo-alpha-1,6-glucosidase [Phycisphaerae bacterium]HPU25408.1 amylo-alpha-1,6-glucosidase [Phycisphaerae bacterium]HPZ98227.1 amylo-alpha-1,6-glucosidase [Phycisphaerae bacterium]
MRTDSVTQATALASGPADLDACLSREWLLTNGRGGYASSTVVGIPTRKYHGLLVAAARPPLQRWMLLSAVVEKVGVSGRQHDMASFRFERTIHPRGYEYQTHFAYHNDPTTPWVRFVYEHDGVRLIKEVIMRHGHDEVLVRYRLDGPPGEPLSLELHPLTPMRDYHSVTRAFPGSYRVSEIQEFVTVDAYADGPRLWMSAERLDGGQAVSFTRQSDWWYGFYYQEEASRGVECTEDLFVPGWFRTQGRGSIEVMFRAVAGFGEQMKTVPESVEPIELAPRPTAQSVPERLAQAAAAFVVSRPRETDTALTTILAGYPWFGDWGRDTFISLPGLLLETGRFAEARQVLEVFASAEKDGLIPNRFSDYGDGRDYNSADAALWFVHAADAYCRQSGDEAAWAEILGSVCARIIEAYARGTRFNIRMEPDGLITCGDSNTQLTWMDAKCNEVVFTPRHGKPVEINALWHHDLCLMARRTDATDPAAAARYREMARRVRESFQTVFWNEKGEYLYDVVRDDWRDLAIRPNQIMAVSLPDSPLDPDRQRAVLRIVERELLTPYGLRSLSPQHPSFCGRYEGTPYERDSAYHQGTVWAWLIGSYVEAYLRVHDFADDAKQRMRELLQPLIAHLDEAGLGSVSEIFDGQPPHKPRGCIAQAWSVAELIRAWMMTERG